jgi:hypothetical protein
MAYVDPSSTNTFVPSWDATGQLVAFVRDPKKFRINEYIAFRNALKPVGLYAAFESEHAIRVPTKEEFAWPDGMPRPEGNANLMGFEYREYRTERVDVPFMLGNRTRKACPWDIVAVQSGMAMSQYMTLLAWQIVTALETSGNWGSNTSTATAAGGGKWDAGTTATPYFQKGLNYAFEQILAATNSLVTKEMLKLVIGVETARKLRTSQEVLDYIKQSPFAMQQIRGEIANRNADFDLPEKLFGVDVVVENGQRVTTRKASDGSYTRGWLKDPDSAFLVSKQDALPGDHVSDSTPVPNFSTFQVFTYIGEQQDDGRMVTADGRETGGQPFTVETFEDTKNRRLDGHVVGDWGLKMVAPESGWLFTDVLT